MNPTDSRTVFLCTSALFLSGYVLQQKTVNDLRRAIKPQIAPLKTNTYLPARFREQELWNGKDAEVVIVEESQTAESSTGNGEGVDESMIGATRWQKAAKLKEKLKLKEEAARKALEKGSKGKKSTKNKKAKDAQDADEKELSRAARRKKIKDDIVAAGGEGFKGYRRRMW